MDPLHEFELLELAKKAASQRKPRYKLARYMPGPSNARKPGQTLSVMPRSNFGATLALFSAAGIFYVNPVERP